MKKIAIIGKFYTDKGVVDGQAIKTTILASEIEKKSKHCTVVRINTFGWKKRCLNLFSESVRAIQTCDHVILMTDAGGIKVFPWLLCLANVKRKCRLHYVVVGGWLVHVLKKNRILGSFLRRFDRIYVETNAMKKGLEDMRFNNVSILLNCKPLVPVSDTDLIYHKTEPYKLCVFSRIMKEKGIEEAVNAVVTTNEFYKRKVYSLDIYGQIDDGQTSWFEKLSETFPDEIKYCGVVPFEKSVDIIKTYFALLFPTKFYTEGIPGTIIDAYASGVPVIASEWENFSDIIEPNVTGIGYPFLQSEILKDILIEIVRNPIRILDMKRNCLNRSYDYLPNNALATLWESLFSDLYD